MCENLGRWLRSFCQQSSMSWCRGGWQFAGAGRRKPSSTAFITCRAGQKGKGTALRRQNTDCTQTWQLGSPPSSPPTASHSNITVGHAAGDSHPGGTCPSRVSRHRT